MKNKFYVQRLLNNKKSTVDMEPVLADAKVLCAMYNESEIHEGEYYVSTRPCKNWGEKK